jgi:outer membrane receptor protein involved in Fe transport
MVRTTLGIEPSVAIFIDGVYRSRAGAAIGDLPNLQRVEVLRGPQSTLFGKNASAGVISLVTREPKFEYGGSAELSYGNFNAIVAKADITGPLGENAAGALSFGYNKRDGYVENIGLGIDINDRDRFNVRADLLIKPSDNLKVRVIADYDKLDEIVLRGFQRFEWTSNCSGQCCWRVNWYQTHPSRIAFILKFRHSTSSKTVAFPCSSTTISASWPSHRFRPIRNSHSDARRRCRLTPVLHWLLFHRSKT